MGKLTIKQLEHLKDTDDGRSLSDGDSVRGTVRLGKQGISVAFTLRYRFGGRSRELHLGSWRKGGDVTLTAIRKKADEARTLLGDGKDPALEAVIRKETARNEQTAQVAALAAQRAELTLAGLVDLWIERDRATAVKDGGAEVRRSFEKDILPTLGPIRVKDLTRGMIALELDRVKVRAPVVARYLLNDLRTMFRWGIVRDLVETDPTYLLEPKKYASKEERERVLKEPEVRTLLVDSLGAAKLAQHTQAAVRIMLATCCRVGEISTARWADVDLKGGTWTIPPERSKNGKAHVVTLSAFARQQFEAIRQTQQERQSKTGRKALPAFVIPSDDWSTHIDTKTVNKQITDRQRETPMANRVAGVNQALVLPGGRWTAHDLRRTGASLMRRPLGVDSDVIERCLNHIKKDRLIRTYQRADWSAEMSQAWHLLGERLALLALPQESNVVVLPTGTTG